MDFITIDFETANSERNSPCEIGLTFVKNKQIVETKSWLIKPMVNRFDYFNTLIHGITWKDVEQEREFDELWVELKPLIENQFLIAHNASFDLSVLRKTLELYQIPFPSLNYSCSYIFSKKVWHGLPSYDLKTLCSLNKIGLNNHRAGADSRATAKLTLKAFDISGVNSFHDFPEKLKITVGELFYGGYRPTFTKGINSGKVINKIVGDPSKYNLDSIFYGKTVVFTGTLSSMVREEAQQIIADLGGINGKTMTSDTDFLIVGQQDYRVVGEDGMSNKQEKALTLAEKGSSLEILSESDYIKNI